MNIIKCLFSASFNPSFWRMMTQDEWTYLLNTRSVSHSRYTFATVNGTKGVILYPDTYTPSAAGAPAVSSGGTVTAANWRKMQLQGCVFLPKAGSETNYKAEAAGLYYTSNKSGSNPYILFIGDNSITTQVYKGGDNCFIHLVHLL